jgi:lipopolysaccharide transport system ATP-binding protein
MEPIIKVENLSKMYVINHEAKEPYVAMRDVITNKFTSVFKPKKRAHSYVEDFWALKDVSFEIKAGDRVGIIGRNGAGKSTLLKVISQVTEPTSGRVIIDGRVASLLEVGTGFHPELTGRENVFLNGAILGMSKREIESKFDEIVAFAEVDKFLDTPVKRYSSGMYVRLAFAVAAHLEPDILIVDEVLAVGDSAFQKKCLGKIEEVSGHGRTVLFVSHNMDTVSRLCNKAILLKAGAIQASGNTEEVINAYLRSDFGTSARRSWANERIKPGNEIVKLLEIRVHDKDFKVAETYDITQPVGVSIDYEVIEDGDVFTHSFKFFNQQGVLLFISHDTTSAIRKQPRGKGIYTGTVWVPGNFLTEGIVIVGVAIIKVEPFKIYFEEFDAASFTVVDHMRGDSARGDYILEISGAVRPLLQWETVKKPNL